MTAQLTGSKNGHTTAGGTEELANDGVSAWVNGALSRVSRCTRFGTNKVSENRVKRTVSNANREPKRGTVRFARDEYRRQVATERESRVEEPSRLGRRVAYVCFVRAKRVPSVVLTDTQGESLRLQSWVTDSGDVIQQDVVARNSPQVTSRNRD